MELVSDTEVTFSEALAVALQHPALAVDQQNICRLLQVCKAWRTAVQQSTACITAVTFKGKLPSEASKEGALATATADIVARIARFAHWLPKCAGTVRSIDLDITCRTAGDAASNSLSEVAHHVVSLGLMAAKHAEQTKPAPGCSNARCAADAAIAPPLRLRGFQCSSSMVHPAIISALPAVSLTQLHVMVPSTVQIHESLSSLANLRSLHLDSSEGISLSDAHLSSINKLSQLTYLLLYPLESTSGLALLPQGLSHLDLCIVGKEGEPAVLDLSQLTQLQQLYADVRCPVDAAHLPEQLQLLNITYCNAAVLALDITSLQQLQQLSINDSKDTTRDLLALKQMQKLAKVELSYKGIGNALAAVSAWSQLSQLSGLILSASSTPIQLAGPLMSLYELTQLTGLELSCTLLEDTEADPDATAAAETQLADICQVLRNLTKLQVLKFEAVGWQQMQEDDVQQLSALTNLTRLQLNLRHDLDSTTAIAVLLELTKLQHLALSDLNEVHALPVIGKLRGLTALSLPELPEQLHYKGLRHLSHLRRLRSIEGFSTCSREDLKQILPSLEA